MKVGAYHGIKTYPQGIKGLAKGPSNIMQCRYRLVYQWIYEWCNIYMWICTN